MTEKFKEQITYKAREFATAYTNRNFPSELPKLAFNESHIDYIDRYGGFCRDCADEDGVCPSSGLPCGGSKKAIRHVLTALAYGVNHGYIPVILCAAPTTTKDAS